MAGLGEAESAAFVLVAAVLLYAGVVAASGARIALPRLVPARDLARQAGPGDLTRLSDRQDDAEAGVPGS